METRPSVRQDLTTQVVNATKESLSIDPDPRKMVMLRAILCETFQPESKFLCAAHGVYIIDGGWK